MSRMGKCCLAVLAVVILGAAGRRAARSLRKVIAAPAPHQDTVATIVRDSTAPVRDLHADSMAVISRALVGIAHNHIDFSTFSGTMHVHYQGSAGQDNEVN